MVHITKEKGDLATIKAMADLTSKGYSILTPVVSEHLPFDFIAYKNQNCFRIQSKHSSNGYVYDRTSWNDKNGNHAKYYKNTDFDYYALYLPKSDVVIYPHISFGGISIRDTMPKSPTPFYWYEDFLDFTDFANKKTYKDFGVELNYTQEFKQSRRKKGTVILSLRKVERPSKEELQKLLWEKPTLQLAKQFGVSDKAIEKWAKAYGLTKPPRGYWSKNKISFTL